MASEVCVSLLFALRRRWCRCLSLSPPSGDMQVGFHASRPRPRPWYLGVKTQLGRRMSAPSWPLSQDGVARARLNGERGGAPPACLLASEPRRAAPLSTAPRPRCSWPPRCSSPWRSAGPWATRAQTTPRRCCASPSASSSRLWPSGLVVCRICPGLLGISGGPGQVIIRLDQGGREHGSEVGSWGRRPPLSYLLGPPPSPPGVPLQCARTLARASAVAPSGRAVWWTWLAHGGIGRGLKARFSGSGRETPFLIGHCTAQGGPGAGSSSPCARAPSGPSPCRVGAPGHPAPA